MGCSCSTPKVLEQQEPKGKLIVNKQMACLGIYPLAMQGQCWSSEEFVNPTANSQRCVSLRLQ